MRRPLSREFYIPTGAAAVRDKASDAVCYVYTGANGRPYALGFAGRRQRPDFHYSFDSAARRESYVREHFEKRRAELSRNKTRDSKGRKLELGHILKSSWGYEQTNVDFYQVTKLIGSTMVELRKIAAVSDETAHMQGNATPKLDAFTGPPIRRRAQGDSVRVDDVRWASLWNGRPVSWTAYH